MTNDGDPITLTVEIDSSKFDEPRQMMFERLVEEYGHETIAELIGANLSQDIPAQGMGLVNALWDNCDQIGVEPDGVETPQVPDQPADYQTLDRPPARRGSQP